MALKLNGVEIYPTQANFNNNSLTKIRFNNVVVWSIDDNYFWIEQLTGASIISYEYINHWTDADVLKEIYYSIDSGVTWTKLKLGGTTIILQSGTKALFKSNDTYNFYRTNGVSLSKARIKITSQLISGNYSQVKVGGKIMSLYNNNSSFPSSDSDNYGPLSYFFQNTRGLVDASDLILPSFTSQACYRNMFKGCVDLVGIPKLPALSLSSYCYADMFDDCTSLKFSETQTDDCQYEFRIPSTGTGTAGTNSTYSMLTNTSGTYHGSPSVNTVYYTNAQGVQPVPPVVEPNYFYIEAYSGESDLKFKFEDTPTLSTPQTVNLLVSTDKNNWSTFQTNTYYTVASGSKMYFKAGAGGNGGTCDDTAYVSRLHFTYEPAVADTTALARIGGDITTLLTENGQMSDMRQSGQTHNFAFLFRNGQGDGTDFRQFYINSDFEIPCSIVQPYAFWQLFRGALAPIDTANNLYNYFPDLSNIEYVGAYSFGTTWCYEQAVHFADNTVVDLSSLKGSTDGTNIADDSRYLDVGNNNGAFRNWLRYERTSFTVKIGPLEPAYYLYDGAFQDSTPSEIEVAFSSFGSGTGNWVRNVPATGTFKCPVALGDNSTIARGNNYCPTGWTVVNI